MSDSLNKVNRILSKFKDLTTLGSANILSTAISGVFWFYVASLLGTTHYGEVSYYIAIAGIASTVSFLGAGTTTIVFTAKGEKILSTIFSITVISTTIASIILFILFRNFGVSLYVIGSLVFSLSTADILGQKLYKDYSKYLITQKILFVGFALGFYYLIGPQGVILGYAISFLPYFARIYHGFKESKTNVSLIRPHFGFMMNSYVLDLSRTFSGQTDKLIVAPMLGFSLLGNYQLGLQFLSLLGILPNIVYQYILPHDSTGKSNKKLKRATILVSVILAVSGILFAPLVLPHLFPKFKEAIGVIRIISLAIIPISINLIYISKFLGSERSRIVLIGSGIYLLVQVLSIFILGKIYGVNGVAGAYVLASFAEALYLITIDRVTQKNYPEKEIEIAQTKEHNESVKRNENFLSSLCAALEGKIEFSKKNIILALAIVSASALIFRLYFLHTTIPLILDALGYFWYANDLSILGHFPKADVSNNGWPSFLAIFFSTFHFNNFLSYMNLQRIVTITISVLTIIPLYYLCRRFFTKTLSLVGAALFVLEPRVIQNSLLGITEPLYIFLLTSSACLILSKNRLYTYAAFGIAALATFVRLEGIFIFITISVWFFIFNRNEKRRLIRFAIGIAIFVLVLLPVAVIRTQSEGSDFLSSRLSGEAVALSNSGSASIHWFKDISEAFKLTGWSLVPIFVFLLPIGLYAVFKNRDKNSLIIIIGIIIMAIPAEYALSLSEAQDTRYLLPLYPFFSILSLLGVKYFTDGKRNQTSFSILIVIFILISSGIFLHLKITDQQHEREALELSRYVTNSTMGINDYNPEGGYVQIAKISELKSFPALSYSVPSYPKIISTDGFTSLEDYIKFGKQQGLTDLIVDDSKNRPEFLSDVFVHEEKYPYLEKIFDSKEHGYKYHLEIFRINYEKFNIMVQ
jgi:O-antigen/teichoic acid export membrane protein/4-amino-4-deoxy-L-arabinose transferase-like glycosyltransferase